MDAKKAILLSFVVLTLVSVSLGAYGDVRDNFEVGLIDGTLIVRGLDTAPLEIGLFNPDPNTSGYLFSGSGTALPDGSGGYAAGAMRNIVVWNSGGWDGIEFIVGDTIPSSDPVDLMDWFAVDYSNPNFYVLDVYTNITSTYDYVGQITIIPLEPRTITVDCNGPSDFNNIQAAINDANYGDTVEVQPGTYTGDGNRDISFKGKMIVVRSTDPNDATVVADTVIDCEGSGINPHRAFYFQTLEDSVVKGFTITHGYARGELGEFGGAIYCYYSSPIIEKCRIVNNYALAGGGGIYGENSRATIVDCIISNNKTGAGPGGAIAFVGGGAPLIKGCYIRDNGNITNNRGALYFEECYDAKVVNCLLTGNKSQWCVYCQYSAKSTLINCTIAGNRRWAWGGGIYCRYGGSAIVTNSICRDNSTETTADPTREIYGPATVTYSNVEFGYTGEGNIDADPLFLATDYYYLGPGSPCIDTGTNSPPGGLPTTDLDGNPRPVDGDSNGVSTADMGAYEFDPELPVVWHSPWQLAFYGVEGESNPADQILSICNIGGGTLDWEVTEDCGWLGLDPNSGQSTGEINDVNVSVDISGLGLGTYRDNLLISSEGASNDSQIVSVALYIKRPEIELSANEFEFAGIEGGTNPDDQILTIRNSSIGTLNWTITYDCYDSNWLTVDPDSGSSSGEPNQVVLSVDCTGLGIGIYNCELTVSDPCAINSPQMVSVTLSVSAGNVDGKLLVPAEYPTIQVAIDWAETGHTVIVSEGIYTGWGNRDIGFKGKAITVRSSDPNDPNVVAATIIDCNGSEAENHRGFYFHSGEGADSVVDGLAITKGHITDGDGGAIVCNGSSPTIIRCRIYENFAGWSGGGIYCSYSSTPTIKDCIFSGNYADYGGGGIYLYQSGGAKVINCIFQSNSADTGGGVGHLVGGEPCTELINCTFWNNQAGFGSGVYLRGTASDKTVVRNSIVWGNSEPALSIYPVGHSGWPYLEVEFSVLQSPWQDGANNIIADPCFADVNNADFHLKSEYGRWDPNSESWVLDDVTSPAIDAGDPNDDYSNEPFPHGYRINIGAYGNTDQASKSLECFAPGHPDYSEWDSVGRPEWWCCPRHCHGDADCDDEPVGHSGFWVGFVDLGILVDNWTDAQGYPAAYQADFSHSAETIGHTLFRVGFEDLQILLDNWTDNLGSPPDCLDVP